MSKLDLFYMLAQANNYKCINWILFQFYEHYILLQNIDMTKINSESAILTQSKHQYLSVSTFDTKSSG